MYTYHSFSLFAFVVAKAEFHENNHSGNHRCRYTIEIHVLETVWRWINEHFLEKQIMITSESYTSRFVMNDLLIFVISEYFELF